MLKNKAYLFYLSGSVISAVGNGMQFIAITWLILELTDSSAQVGITLAIGFIPLMCLSSFGGMVADRYDRRIIMVAFNIFRFFSISIVPFVYWFGDLTIFIIYLMQLLNAVGTAYFVPANAAFVREIMADKEMYRANALTQVWIQVGKLSGAGIGGIFVAWFGSINVVFLNALTFLIGAVLIYKTRKGYVSPNEESPQNRNFWRDMNVGFKLVITQKNLLFYVGLSLLPAIFVYIYNLSVAIFVRNELGKGAESLGIIEGAYAAGALVIGVVISKHNNWLKNTLAIPLVIFIMAIPFVLFSLSNEVLTAAISVFLLGAAFQIGFTMFNTLLQITPPKAFVGRVTGFAKTLQSLLTFVALLYFGNWLESHSVRVLFSGIFALFTTVSLLTLTVVFFSQKQLQKNQKQSI
ncbi:MFS transporter [Planococcus salinarum]|uniref:MFS transporter n=1 Tax=Planococcus salinarum TaxID=622695 RepID=UPI000E3CC3F6|nr:MFS transporter [Planococcus salinarum]TAA70498.1 MFS transporter [Planococcus salinarum]